MSVSVDTHQLLLKFLDTILAPSLPNFIFFILHYFSVQLWTSFSLGLGDIATSLCTLSPNQKSSLRFFFNSKVNKKASSGQNKACELTFFLHQFTAFANLRTVYHFLSWYLGDYVKPFVSILLFELLFDFASVFTNNTQQLTSFTLILTLPFHLLVKYNWHASIAYVHVNNYLWLNLCMSLFVQLYFACARLYTILS